MEASPGLSWVYKCRRNVTRLQAPWPPPRSRRPIPRPSSRSPRQGPARRWDRHYRLPADPVAHEVQEPNGHEADEDDRGIEIVAFGFVDLGLVHAPEQ